MPEPSTPDPIVSRSFSTLLLVSVFLLMVTVAWSLYAEFFGLRPWRGYQRDFTAAYDKYLNTQIKQEAKTEAAVTSSPDYKKLKADLDAAISATKAQDAQNDQQVAVVEEQRTAMTPAFQDARGKVGALIFQLEIIPDSDKSAKASQLKDVIDAKNETREVKWPLGGGQTELRKLNYDQLNKTFTDLMAAKAQLVNQRGDVDAPVKEAQDKLNDYVKKNLPGVSLAGLEGLRNSLTTFKVDLRQINVNPSGTMINYLGGIGLVDRCQSCHIAMDPLVVPVTMTLTKADLGMAKSTMRRSRRIPTPIFLHGIPSNDLAARLAMAGTGARWIQWKRLTGVTSTGCGR